VRRQIRGTFGSSFLLLLHADAEYEVVWQNKVLGSEHRRKQIMGLSPVPILKQMLFGEKTEKFVKLCGKIIAKHVKL
jgi:hypothetical protein